jgi:hypothetical protein
VVGSFDQRDRAGQHRGKAPEAAFDLAFLGEHEQPLLGRLDLLAAGFRQGSVVGLVDQLLADVNQPSL